MDEIKRMKLLRGNPYSDPSVGLRGYGNLTSGYHCYREAQGIALSPTTGSLYVLFVYA